MPAMLDRDHNPRAGAVAAPIPRLWPVAGLERTLLLTFGFVIPLLLLLLCLVLNVILLNWLAVIMILFAAGELLLFRVGLGSRVPTSPWGHMLAGALLVGGLGAGSIGITLSASAMASRLPDTGWFQILGAGLVACACAVAFLRASWSACRRARSPSRAVAALRVCAGAMLPLVVLACALWAAPDTPG